MGTSEDNPGTTPVAIKNTTMTKFRYIINHPNMEHRSGFLYAKDERKAKWKCAEFMLHQGITSDLEKSITVSEYEQREDK
jgi:hypothetical protein